MYHVAIEHNPADFDTRPAQVTVEDITQGSTWILGVEWMKHGIHDAVKKDILKPVSELRLASKEEINEHHDGCVFDQIPKVLIRGHVLNEKRN